MVKKSIIQLRVVTPILFFLFMLFLGSCEKQISVDDQETIDYYQMSKEEIITEFMKAWEKDDIEVMEELSDFSEDTVKEKNFEDHGYHSLFCWGGVSLVGEKLICDHGCESFSHAVNDLKIRQSDNTDYGCSPEELQKLHPNYEDIYIVSFSIDENSIIRHLEVCIFGGKEGSMISDYAFERDGVYKVGAIFKMEFDEEKGHWVIIENVHAL